MIAFSRLSYECSTFLQLEMKGPKPMAEGRVKALHMDVYSLGVAQYFESGRSGRGFEQPILFPMRSEPNAAWTGSGMVKWTELKWDQNPMQWHIIKALAGLPILQMSPVMRMQGRVILMEDRGRVLR